jgi:hypothetical protein
MSKKYLDGFLSDVVLNQKNISVKEEEVQIEPQNKKQEIQLEEKNKSKIRNKYKGFYITKENEVKLQKLKAYLLENDINKSDTDLLNEALQLLFKYYDTKIL